jgi:predicted Rossmann fold flavoprotein
MWSFDFVTDVVVIGAGAAGLMCARAAGQRGRSVLVLERADRIGNKILISGGGRCNFTNLHAGPANYLSSAPNFCKSALARFSPRDFIDLVEAHGIAYHEKKLGQLFCDHSSRDIVEMLRRECADAAVEIQTSTEVTALRRRETGFEIETSRGTVSGGRLVIATGGLSLPKLGATDFAYRAARQFGVQVLPVRAGLVPFTFSGAALDFCRPLCGLSTACAVATEDGTSFREQMLFTHRGLSGPAMLQASSYWGAGTPIRISLFPDGDARGWLEENRTSGAQLHTLLARRMPERLATAWAAQLGPPRALRSLAAMEREEIARKLESWTLQPAGTEGYATAEVTVGGIDPRELDSKTLEARAVPGLHFIGEAVDVTGWLGGYNFQWAWASGNACGVAA